MNKIEATTGEAELHRAALELYCPPFRFEHGYIFDNDNNMVADQDDECAAAVVNKVARVRGWGRISYMQNPDALQDAVGGLIAQALTEYWARCASVEGEPK